MKMKQILLAATMLSTLVLPTTAFAQNSSQSGQSLSGLGSNGASLAGVSQGGTYAPGLTTTAQNQSKGGTKSSSSSNNSSSGSTKTACTSVSCTISSISSDLASQVAATTTGDSGLQLGVTNGGNGGTLVTSKSNISTTTSSSGIVQEQPLYAQWKFNDVSNGASQGIPYAPPVAHTTESFSSPGHWYAYYRIRMEYWTGYYVTETVTATVTYNGVTTTESYPVTKAVVTGGPYQAWMPDWTYVVDFYISDAETGAAYCVPGCVEKTTPLNITTVQTVAK